MATSFEVSVTGFNLGTGESSFGTAKTWSLNPTRIVSVVDQTTQRRIDYWWNKTQIAQIYTSASLATIEGLLEGGTFLPTTILTSYDGNGVLLTGAAQSVIFMARNIVSFNDNGSSTTFITYNMGNINIGTYIVNETYANVKTALVQSETSVDFYAADGTAGAPSYSFTNDTDGGIYRASDGVFAFSSEGAAVGGWNASGMLANVIGELTANSGVTADAVLLKDGQTFVVDGIVGAPSYSFTNNFTSGLYSIGVNDIGFAVNGVKTQEWTTTGSLVFGTFSSSGHLGVGGSATSTSPLNITSIPTSSAGLVSGDVWSNLGVLTIV